MSRDAERETTQTSAVDVDEEVERRATKRPKDSRVQNRMPWKVLEYQGCRGKPRLTRERPPANQNVLLYLYVVSVEKFRPSLLYRYCAPPRYQPQVEAQDGRYNEDPLLVYDYAVGGDRLPGLQRQIQRQFLPYMTPGPDAPALWTPDDSLFGMD